LRSRAFFAIVASEVRARVLAFLLVCTACAQVPQWRGEGEIPSEIAWLALFVEGSDTSIGTGFVPRSHDAFRVFADVPSSPSDVWVFGLTDAHLKAMGAPSDEPTLRARAIRRASPTEPILTNADWIGRGVVAQDAIQIARADGPPEVTVDWLPPCPEVLTSSIGYVDIPCLSTPCDGRVRRNGCDLTIDLPECSATIEAHVDGRGQLTYDPSAAFGPCHAIPPGEGAVAAFSCPGEAVSACVGQIYTTASQSPPVHIDMITVAPNGYPTPQALSPFGIDDVGYMIGPAVLPDRVAVLVYDQFKYRGACGEGTFTIIDPDTLAVTRTSTSFTCLAFLAADPSGPGFVGVQWLPTTSVVRFDPNGVITDSAPIRPAMGAQSVVAAHDRIAAVHSGDASARPPKPSLLWLYGEGALGEPAPIMLASDAHLAGVLDDGTIVAIDRPGELQAPVVELVDKSGVVTAASPSPQCPAASVASVSMSRTATIVVMASRGRAQTLGTHRTAIVWEQSTPPSCADVVFFEAPSLPWSSHVWPNDPRFFLVGLDTVGAESFTNEDVGPTRIAFLDLQRGAYRVGSIPVGRGPLREMAADAKGRIWAALPWEGKVLRIAPAP
jgi:hypothetical protein